MTDYDIIQIGLGPVGLSHAALLGRYGHRVGVFERWPNLYPLPRAGHIDHEIMRILQGMGAAEAVERKVIPIPDYDWFNGAGELLLHLDWNNPTPSGWKSDYLMYQPDLEDEIRLAAERQGTVELNRGWELADFTQFDDHVEVQLREGRVGADGGWEPTGAVRTVTARYLIGADGAGSTVRRRCGIGWTDFGFQEQWLVVDVRPNDPAMDIDMPEAGQIADPARPVSLFRWLGREHARWEFMLLPGESAETMSAEDTCWQLLARWGVTPDNATLVRRAVYTFQSLLAEKFRDRRVMLIGDAAHLMPPFMGQGMCSGIRDAANLAWKLDLVLRSVASDDLLDSYGTERSPHVEQLIHTSMALGSVVCVADPAQAAERDRLFFAGEAPPPPPFPWLSGGVVADVDPAADGIVGHLGVQGRVVSGNTTALLDDVVGPGWQLIVDDRAIIDGLEAGHRNTLDTIGAALVPIHRARLDDGFVDVDATYHRWMRDGGFRAVLVRPDFYVYGTASGADELGALLDRLATHLSLRSPAGAAS